MVPPKVSVIIPTYNQADFLSEAIQSVLDQTYPEFEVVVVNDASPDHTDAVIDQFNDQRLKYIRHTENQGLPGTRNTGMRASSGELIALLDSDDYFHPDKLEVHVDFMDHYPEVGVSYNARYELQHSSKEIRELSIPPQSVDLKDFVLGFPFAPSDMVVRREWAFKVDLFDQRCICGAEDIDFPCRLALAGCRFAGINRALNYRRYHSDKIWRNLTCRIEDAIRVLDRTLNDPRCPADISALRETAVGNHYQVLTYIAFVQGDIELAHEFLRESIRLKPEIIQGNPCPYAYFLTQYACADKTKDHREILEGIFDHLPQEFMHLREQKKWAIARGYLILGTRAIMWGRAQEGKVYFQQAVEAGAVIDESFLRKLAGQLLDFATEFGYPAAENAMNELAPFIKSISGESNLRDLRGIYFINKSFRKFRNGNNPDARNALIQAISIQPAYLLNRGAISVFLRTFTNNVKNQ